MSHHLGRHPVHLLRSDVLGYIYEWVSPGRYRLLTDHQGGAVPIAPQEIMFPVEGEFFTRTHRCVMMVACPFCGAPKGARCRGAFGPHSDTHYRRRDAARDLNS